MDQFSKKSFPAPLYAKKPERNIFSAFGSQGHLDVSEDDIKECFVQHVPEGYLDNRIRYLANGLTFPLLQEPELDRYPFMDGIRGELNKTNEYVLDVVRYITKGRACGPQQEYWENMTKISTLLEDIKTNDQKQSFMKMLKSLLRKGQTEELLEAYTSIKDVAELYKINADYTGGCLSHISCCHGDECLISPFKADLTHVTLSKYSTLTNGRLQGEIKGQHNFIDKVLQVETGIGKNEGLVLVRGKSKCELLKLNCEESTSVFQCLSIYASIGGDNISSIGISPYLSQECLIATTCGNVCLWKPGVRKEMVLRDVQQRFPCNIQWCQAEFGAHPRQIMLADRTVVQLFDLRKSPGHALDLFALPNCQLHPHERIHVMKTDPSSHHRVYMATDHTLFLLDERFPGHSMLMWKHTIPFPPTYISCCTLEDAKYDVVTIASQSPADVCCYKVDTKSSSIPQSLGGPWSVSSIDDFVRNSEICSGPDMRIIEDRFKTSLAGVDTVSNSKGFTVFQMDSFGDIFFQTYHQSSERTRSEPLLTDDIVPIGQKWVKHVCDFVKEKKIKRECSKSEIERSSLFSIDDAIPDIPSHIRCELCTPKVETFCEKIYNSDDDLFGSDSDDTSYHGNDEEDICHACMTKLNIGKDLLQANEELPARSYAKPELSDLESTQPVAEDLSHSDAFSQILIKLWDEDYDLQELIIKRDTELIDRKKKCFQRKKLTNILQNEGTFSRHSDRNGSEENTLNSPSCSLPPSSDDTYSINQSDMLMTRNDTFTLRKLDQSSQSYGSTETSAVYTKDSEKPSNKRRRHSSVSSFISCISDTSISSHTSDGFRSIPSKMTKYRTNKVEAIKNTPTSSKSNTESELHGEDLDNTDDFCLLRSPTKNSLEYNKFVSSKKDRNKRKFVSGF